MWHTERNTQSNMEFAKFKLQATSIHQDRMDGNQQPIFSVMEFSKLYRQANSTYIHLLYSHYCFFCLFFFCKGAIDDKHIVMQAPADTGSQYINDKGRHSVVNALFWFILIDIGVFTIVGILCSYTTSKN